MCYFLHFPSPKNFSVHYHYKKDIIKGRKNIPLFHAVDSPHGRAGQAGRHNFLKKCEKTARILHTFHRQSDPFINTALFTQNPDKEPQA